MSFIINKIKNYDMRDEIFKKMYPGLVMISFGFFFPIFFELFINLMNAFEISITNQIGQINQGLNITHEIKGVDELKDFNKYLIHIWSSWVILIGFAYIIKSITYTKKKDENEIEEIKNNIDVLQEINNQIIDFKNEKINNFVVEIDDLATKLLNTKIVKENPDWNFLVNKSKKEYILNIYEIYIGLPNNEKNIDETKKQLLIVLSGLKKIECEIQNKLYESQKVNKKFLEEKVKAIGE